ncbi:MAG: hypothetical protein JWQ63_4094 [Mucilaginibacter sp.]|nr:hypothetical protein [Mucilaginibacter sp.]
MMIVQEPRSKSQEPRNEKQKSGAKKNTAAVTYTFFILALVS